MGGGGVLWGGFGDIAECDVVVGGVLFGMHFSQQKMHFYLIKSRQYLVQSGFEPGAVLFKAQTYPSRYGCLKFLINAG